MYHSNYLSWLDSSWSSSATSIGCVLSDGVLGGVSITSVEPDLVSLEEGYLLLQADLYENAHEVV